MRVASLACLGRLRLKEWDFYATTTREMNFSVAVAHGGILGVVYAEVIDYRTRTSRERRTLTPFGRGCVLPASSESGDVSFRGRGVEVAFRKREGRREIDVDWARFDGDGALAVRLVASEPAGHESIVIATPIGARGFYYNRKTCAMPTEGTVAVGAAEPVDLGARRALTTLDWGRGLWPYRTFWVWASGSGWLADGRTFGLNLGGGFGDSRAATEDCLFVDGRMTKLGPVEIEYDRDDPGRGPWRFRAPDGRLSLELRPELHAVRKRVNALAIASDLRQITGLFRGFAVTDAGERLELGEREGVVGWAEEHRARW